eukprot:gene18341-21874_t
MRLYRYLNAAHALAYVGLSPAYGKEHLWDILQDNKQLLTHAENERVISLDLEAGGSASREVVSWICIHLSAECKAGRLNKQNKQLLLEKVVALRASYATLYDLADQPVPFFYAHLIALMTYVYLPLYSYALATDDSAADTSKPHEFMGTLLIMFNGLFFVGLRVIAERMQEPFGAEIEHLSVMHYIVETEKGSRRIIGSMPPDFPSDAQEQELEADREDLGPPYEHMTTSSTRRQRRKSKFPGLMYTINSKDERPLNPPEALRKYKSVR